MRRLLALTLLLPLGSDDHDLRHIEYDWNLNDSARSSVVRTGSYNPAPRNGV